jgi:hypothetical protein
MMNNDLIASNPDPVRYRAAILDSLERSARLGEDQMNELRSLNDTLDIILSETSGLRSAQLQGLALQQAMLARDVFQDKMEELVYQFEKTLKSFEQPSSEYPPSTQYYIVDGFLKQIESLGISTAVIKGRENKGAFDTCMSSAKQLHRKLTTHPEVKEALAWAERESQRQVALVVQQQNAETERERQKQQEEADKEEQRQQQELKRSQREDDQRQGRSAGSKLLGWIRSKTTAASTDDPPAAPEQIYTHPKVLRYYPLVLKEMGVRPGLAMLNAKGKPTGAVWKAPDGNAEFHGALQRFIAGHIFGAGPGGSKIFLRVHLHDAITIIKFLDQLQAPGTDESLVDHLNVTEPNSLARWVQRLIPVHPEGMVHHGYTAGSDEFGRMRKATRQG